ncbi:DUF1287 domain-containing protein [Methylovulum psychrotolerans]|uniref:DUF1287 domain-containing protein n=1 Tax=Methylovulum psychrotolerans TaxID=1704499 RepID=UPI001BFFAFD8|nr:DUF1287 domain-containing protein [Methylovulum psychrotolerans]
MAYKAALRFIALLALPLVTRAEPHYSPLGLVQAARAQIGVTVTYDPAYRTLRYPNGDVPMAGGVCTDVVIRALRSSAGLDLQQAVHEDMQAHFARYPKQWRLHSTDKNIDHRRVLNLQTYFQRRGYALPLSTAAADFQAGDLVTATIPPNLPHIMVVSTKTTRTGRPFVIHNIGNGVQEEDRLFEFKITGHYRLH